MAAQTTRPPTINGENFSEWMRYLLPSEGELGFASVGFHTALWEAIVQANSEDKPILLWAMNGHPMACT